jgi:menaquinone-dependent protoporphyrinogen IX oxidase
MVAASKEPSGGNMSKTLVAYASKTGTAKEAAEQIALAIPDAELVDLTSTTPLLDGYDAVIIGGGVRMGSVHKATKQFIDANASTLSTKKAAYFISNSFMEDAPVIIEKMLSGPLLSQAVFAGSIGGRMDASKLKGADKLVAMMAQKVIASGKQLASDLDNAAIQSLVAEFS